MDEQSRSLHSLVRGGQRRIFECQTLSFVRLAWCKLGAMLNGVCKCRLDDAPSASENERVEAMKRPSGGRGKQLAKVVPLLNQLTQDVLYDDVWERPLLTKR